MASSGAAGRRKLIIDCDPGTDDAESILMSLAYSDVVELIAITTVLGNASIENTTRNALRILKFTNRLDIPVYRGCSKTLIGGPEVNDSFHGHDGLGDVTIEGVDPVDLGLVQKDPASLALINLVSKYPGEITLLALGPLTNVAAALIVDEEFGKKLKDCVIMGGNLTGCGNITRTAEFNFFSDPEAAHKVLQDLGRQITLIPLDTCLDYPIPWDTFYEMVGQNNRTCRLVKSIDEHMIGRSKSRWLKGFVTWDQIATAVVIRPDCVLEAKVVTAAVELHGNLTKGQVVVGERKTRDTWHGLSDNVRVVTKIDEKIFHQLLNHSINYDFS